MVKIRVSFVRQEELERIKELLAPVLVSCRVSRNQEGRYKKAYLEISELDEKTDLW